MIRFSVMPLVYGPLSDAFKESQSDIETWGCKKEKNDSFGGRTHSHLILSEKIIRQLFAKLILAE